MKPVSVSNRVLWNQTRWAGSANQIVSICVDRIPPIAMIRSDHVGIHSTVLYEIVSRLDRAQILRRQRFAGKDSSEPFFFLVSAFSLVLKQMLS